MKRSGGVTASAIATIAGSLLFLFFAAIMFVARAYPGEQRGMPTFVRTSLLIFSLMLLLLSLGGILTAIGLFRLRRWSRISILIFSGTLAVIFGLSAAMILIAPFPQNPGAPAITIAMKVGIGFFYGLIALLGAGWLYFFNRKTIKEQFESSTSNRALSIRIIAGLFLLAGVTGVVMAFLPIPAAFLGLFAVGTTAHLLNAGYGAIALGTGVGLLRLNPLARKVAIGFCVFYAINSLLFIVLPGYPQRMNASLAILPPEMRTSPDTDLPRNIIMFLLPGGVFYGLTIWFLITRRSLFVSGPSAGMQSE